MALLSTLSVAADVFQGIRARRTNQDPSTQEAEASVRAYLSRMQPALRLALTRLRISTAYSHANHASHPPVASAQRFDQLMRLNRLHRTLHVVHQRLLSLYPAVSATLIEAARSVESTAGQLIDEAPEPFESNLDDFIAEGFCFVDQLASEL